MVTGEEAVGGERDAYTPSTARRGRKRWVIRCQLIAIQGRYAVGGVGG